MFRVALAVLHLLALAFGLRAALARGIALKSALTAESLSRALRADTEWGIAAALWIATGLWRYLGGVEKPTSYYNHNMFFMAKMTLLVAIFALEIYPVVTLTRWRSALRRTQSPTSVVDPKAASRIATISFVQVLFTIVMVVCATAMARGYGITPAR